MILKKEIKFLEEFFVKTKMFFFGNEGNGRIIIMSKMGTKIRSKMQI